MKNLKKFEDHSDYNTYISGSSKILPNVSLCKNLNEVHYGPEPKVVAVFDVNTTTNNTYIMYYGRADVVLNLFSEIEIDGIVQPNVSYSYKFDTLGLHTVKYTLKDNTVLREQTFFLCARLVSVDLPSSIRVIEAGAIGSCSDFLTTVNIKNGVDTIGANAFYYNSSLKNIKIPPLIKEIKMSTFERTAIESITIPERVTNIGNFAFRYCPHLDTVVVLSTVPPTLGSNVFLDDKENRKIYVPAESVDTYKATAGWSTYANDIEAIP